MEEANVSSIKASQVPETESGDERALRRAVHELGSRDFELRAIARTHLLSAADASLPVLMRELKADRQRTRSVAGRVALLVACIVLLGPLGIQLNKPWLVPVSNIAACLVLLFSCLLFTRPAWHSEASKLLAKYHGHDVTLAMIETLTDVWGEEQPRLRAAIIERLASVKPGDESWLKGDALERVIALVSMPNWSSPTCVDDNLTIARALGAIGATEALPVLKGMNCESLQGERAERLREGLKEVIQKLEETAEHKGRTGKLLRTPVGQAAAYVRPAEAQSSESVALLQPAEEVDSTPRS